MRSSMGRRRDIGGLPAPCARTKDMKSDPTGRGYAEGRAELGLCVVPRPSKPWRCATSIRTVPVHSVFWYEVLVTSIALNLTQLFLSGFYFNDTFQFIVILFYIQQQLDQLSALIIY